MTTRRGIDVSHYQHPGGHAIDWAAVHGAGVDWVAIKLTEGSDYVDPWAARDLAGAKAAGLETVLYHFARPTRSSPQAQAHHFLEQVAHVGGSDAACIDVEDGRQMGWHALGAWVHGYLDQHAAQLVYWTEDYRHHLKPLMGTHSFADWVAAPSAHQLPAGASVWQRQQGTIAGVQGHVDVDEIHYDRAHPPWRP